MSAAATDQPPPPSLHSPPFGPAAAFLLHFLFILLCSRWRAVYLHRVALVLAQKSQIERRARTPFEAFERVGELSPKLEDSFSPIPHSWFGLKAHTAKKWKEVWLTLILSIRIQLAFNCLRWTLHSALFCFAKEFASFWNRSQIFGKINV